MYFQNEHSKIQHIIMYINSSVWYCDNNYELLIIEILIYYENTSVILFL